MNYDHKKLVFPFIFSVFQFFFSCENMSFSGIMDIRKEVETVAQNAKDLQLRELKDLVNELRETTKLLRKTLEDVQKEKAAIQQERDNFKEQVDYLTKKLFGSSSEKRRL